MDREKAIRALRTFVSDSSRTDAHQGVSPEILAAVAFAADFLEQHPKGGEHSFFYTFGTDPKFPFGINDFVEVYADTRGEADRKFQARFPNRPGSNCINCAFIYDETQWQDCLECYGDKKPAVVID